MTLKTWRNEFMPKMPTKRLNKRQAIEHSLRKWRGLTKANLKKHGVFQFGNRISDYFNELEIGENSCALCIKYLNQDADEKCALCPLCKTLGKTCDGRNASPYGVWIMIGNANPMIRALEKTLANLDL